MYKLSVAVLSTGFKYPIAMSSFGQVFSAIASAGVCRVFKIGTAGKNFNVKFYVTNIMPIGFFMAATLMAGNAVYMYLSVSFIQMLKAFTPVFTMVGLYIAGLEVRFLSLICVHNSADALVSSSLNF